MDVSGYATLTRQSGLMNEMQLIAHNIANANTTGYRREDLIFTEHVVRMPDTPSLSMAHGNARALDLQQGGFSQTGGAFDLAIEGDGFFLVEGEGGQKLTRAGVFTPSPEGALLSVGGFTLLDAGGAPILLPPEANNVLVAQDGTMSANGQPFAQVGLWQHPDPTNMRREHGTMFAVEGALPAEGGLIRQGFLENSNVDPIIEIARMIEVQRAYEYGQKFTEQENEREKSATQTLGR